MTEDYKDFLNWATPQITANQYLLLCKIIYSFKKYKETDEPSILNVCKFKDDGDGVYTCGHFSHFFAEMGKLAGKYPKQFFETWYNDNVIFWPYKETPDLKEARQRLIQKCETHITLYRFLYIFRENEYGEITLFEVMNKYFIGSPFVGSPS